MVEAVGLQVFGDIGVDQPDLAVLGIGIVFGDGGFAAADRLDLGAGQRNSCLHGILDSVIEPGLAVFGDDLDRALVLFGHYRSFPAKPSAIALSTGARTSRLFEEITDLGQQLLLTGRFRWRRR